MFEILVLVCAAFFAGCINSIAGGGSFLTFPALVYTGVPVIAANATSAISVFPGYISSTIGFLDELKSYDRRQLIIMSVLATLGGIVGALLLLLTPGRVFSAVVPWLLLFATVLFAVGDRIADFARRHQEKGSVKKWITTLLVSIYGGYFNGGLGIILLALFSTLGLKDLKLMSGLKNYLSAILSLSSVITFALAGIIFWKQAIIMMVASTIGGFVGAIIVHRLSQPAIRSVVILIGTAMTIAFFIKG